MPTADELLERANAWIEGYWNADHLRRTLDWLLVLAPDARGHLRLAALTHDMERAYPGPDSPVADARRPIPDRDYDRLHQERSARIVADWLRGQGAEPALVERVRELIEAHEEGGWPEADLLQAADSLSFLETNVDLFVGYAREGKHHYTPERVRERMRYMYQRIRLPQARELARPLYEAALARIDAVFAREASHPGRESPG